MKRAKGYVELNVVDEVIKYMNKTNQKYVALHHMGEALLHPKLGEILEKFNTAGIRTEFSTNGKKLANFLPRDFQNLSRIRIAVDYFYDQPDCDLYISAVQQWIADANLYAPKLEIRIHTITGKDLYMFKRLKCIIENKTFDNWAGQVEGDSKLEKSNSCYFVDYNYVVITWDGKIIPCCMDFDASRVKGYVMHGGLETVSPNRMCKCMCEDCARMQFADGGEWEHVYRK